MQKSKSTLTLSIVFLTTLMKLRLQEVQDDDQL